MIIYLDLDGVLADFDKAVSEHGIVNRNNYIHRPKDTWSEEEKDLDRQVTKVMGLPNFWSSIPMMTDGIKLWEYCKPYNPFILTAYPKNPDWSKRVAEEKWNWVQTNLGLVDRARFICCLRSEKTNFINSAPHEHQVLIDDMEINCEEWVKAGGKAILHIDTTSSIEQLEYLTKESEFV